MPNWASIVRLLRRRLVLGIIFALSLTYCAISLLSHEKLASSLRRIHIEDDDDNTPADNNRNSLVADYHENGNDELFDGSSKNLAWQLELENNYEAVNDDPIDTAPANHDTNDTVVLARNCRNSVQGKALIVDERGYVCARSELLPNGCCSSTKILENTKEAEKTNDEISMSQKIKRYSCDTCNPQGCCAIYEYCVSCCLQSGKRRGKKEAKNIVDRERRENSKIARRADDDAFKQRLRNLDRFQICLATCRTSSASVQHENTYKDPETKHCYTNYQRYRRDESILKNNNADNHVVVVTSSSTLILL